MFMRNKVDMLSGPIASGLLSMAVPIMIMNVLQNLFNIIDMTVLGKYANDTAVGAVGACGVLITLCTGLLVGVSTGANVVVAKRLGAHDQLGVEKAVGTSIATALAGGIALAFIGIALAEPLLTLINCPDSILPSAVLYFRLYFCGVPFQMLYNFSASILRASGDTKHPMYFFTFSGIVKVALNFLFIIFLDMTVDGVAYATIIANVISSALAFTMVIRSKDRIHFTFSALRFHLDELREILFIGIPAGLQSALYSLANAVISTAVNGFGENATTGIAIANQFDGVLYQISCATSYAATPYIAQNVGAGNIKRVKQAFLKAIFITVAFGASFGSLSAIFSGQLSSIMSSTPEVIAFSQQKMVIISSTYFICGINEVTGGVLRGLGKPIYPTIATMLFMCLFRFVWVYVIFPLCPNLTFLYLVWPIGWISSIIMLLAVYFPTISKLQKANEVTN